MSAREWLDPIQLYNPSTPAGRLKFAWGLFIYPTLIYWFITTGIDILLNYFSGDENPPWAGGVMDYYNLAAWAGMILIILRRMKDLGKNWIHLLIFFIPTANQYFFLFLCFKSGIKKTIPAPA